MPSADSNSAASFLPQEDNLDIGFTEAHSNATFQDLHFEACSFQRCDFTKARFENVSFIDCRFTDCDLTMTELPDSTLNGVVFEECRLRGIDWTRISQGLLSLEFHDCVLDYGNFEEMKLKKTTFTNGSAEEASFDRADLREADFSGARLTRATFASADLRKADFRGATDLALELNNCRCDGLKLRLMDAEPTLRLHGIRITP